MLFKQRDGEGWIKVQTTICVLLIIFMFVSAFIPLYTVDVHIPKTVKSAVNVVETVLNDPSISDGDEIKIEFPEKLNVNILLFFRAGTKVPTVIKLYKNIEQLADNITQSNPTAYNQAMRNLKKTAQTAKDLVTSSDFSNILALGATGYSAYLQSPTMMAIMIIMVLLTVIFPIAMFFPLVRALFTLVIHRRNVEKRYLSIMRIFKSTVKIYIVVIGISLLGSGVNLSLGVLIGLAGCIFGFLFSAFANRFKNRTEIGRKYLNTVQLVSIMQMIFFFCFFNYLLKTEIVTQYTALISRKVIPYIRSKAYGTEFLEQFIFMLLAFATLLSLLASLSVLMGAMSRFGGMVGRNKDINIISSSCTVLLTSLLIYALKKHEEAIVLPDNGKLYMTLSLVFAVLIVACEVLIICRNQLKFKGQLKESERHAILTGLSTVETETYNEEDN